MASFIDMDAAFIHMRRDLEYQIFRFVSCRDTAADLATEIYLKLKRVAPVCTTEAEARAYLHKMAKSAAIDHIRSAHRRREILATHPVEMEMPAPSLETVLTTRSEAEIVQAAMAELPERMRDMLYMSRMLGMSYKEIAAEFGVSRSLTEKVVVEALTHCRQRLRELADWEAEREISPEPPNIVGVRRVIAGLRDRIRKKSP